MAHEVATSRTDEVARVAYAIWEAEGRPEGRDQEHWARAERMLDEGTAYADYPSARSGPSKAETPGPRDPAPLPATGEEGFVTVPSEENAAPGALAENPATPPSGGKAAPRRQSRAAPKKSKEATEDPAYVRPAGRKAMQNPPSTWSKVDEEVDESFPASDPPGNY
jgi:hypothetical protein